MAKLGDTVKGARVLGARIRAAEAADPEGRMSLIDHIRELRNRVVKIVLALLVGTAIGLIPVVYNRVWNFVEHPFCAAKINGATGCHRLGDQLVLSGILDPFMLRVQVAFFFGLVLTSPIWLYQIWAFVAPGLYRREKRWTYAFVGVAVPLFLIGAGIAYFAMSRGLTYLLGLTPDGVLNLPPVSTYLGYFFGMVLGFGLAFELPLLVRAQRGPRPHPPVLPQVAPADHLRGVRVRRHRLAEPGSADHAPARRALRGAGRGGRAAHLDE